jgi:hypothetical protein
VTPHQWATLSQTQGPAPSELSMSRPLGHCLHLATHRARLCRDFQRQLCDTSFSQTHRHQHHPRPPYTQASSLHWKAKLALG